MSYLGLIYAFTATLFFLAFISVPSPRVPRHADFLLSAAFAFTWPVLCVIAIIACCSKSLRDWITAQARGK